MPRLPAGPRFSGLTLLLSLGLLLSSWPAAADDFIYKDWQMACEHSDRGQQVCHIAQRLSLKDSGKTVLIVQVGYLPGGTQPVALLQVPLGVSLPPGLMLQVDTGKIYRWPYESCDTTGCAVTVSLGDELVQALRVGKTAYVIMAERNRQGLRVPVSLLGFNAGLAALPRPE